MDRCHGGHTPPVLGELSEPDNCYTQVNVRRSCKDSPPSVTGPVTLLP